MKFFFWMWGRTTKSRAGKLCDKENSSFHPGENPGVGVGWASPTIKRFLIMTRTFDDMAGNARPTTFEPGFTGLPGFNRIS